MGFSWIGQFVLGRFDRWRDDRVILSCKSHISYDRNIILTAGCPGIIFRITSKGKRPAKIKAVKVILEGRGFLKEFEAGFEKPFGHIPMVQESLQEEKLLVTCLGLDKPTCQYGWTINRDDCVRFFYPAGFGLSAKFATSLCDNLSVAAISFDDEETEIVSGEHFQAELQPVLDECIKNNFACHQQIQINISVKSQTPPGMSSAGQINTRPIKFKSEISEPSDFVENDQ